MFSSETARHCSVEFGARSADGSGVGGRREAQRLDDDDVAQVRTVGVGLVALDPPALRVSSAFESVSGLPPFYSDARVRYNLPRKVER
jgi:hypothetical protein